MIVAKGGSKQAPAGNDSMSRILAIGSIFANNICQYTLTKQINEKNYWLEAKNNFTIQVQFFRITLSFRENHWISCNYQKPI